MPMIDVHAVHDLAAGSFSNVVGDSDYVRVQVLTPVADAARAEIAQQTQSRTSS